MPLITGTDLTMLKSLESKLTMFKTYASFQPDALALVRIFTEDSSAAISSAVTSPYRRIPAMNRPRITHSHRPQLTVQIRKPHLSVEMFTNVYESQ